MIQLDASENSNKIYMPSLLDQPLRQGEILTNVIQIKLDLDSIETEEVLLDVITHKYAIVVSQDCDLDWDYKSREEKAKEHKRIPSILLCEITTVESLSKAILELDGTEKIKKSRTWSRIAINKDERYQFFQKVEETQDLAHEGLPELGVDFKRYFTIPTDELYLRIKTSETQRRCCLQSPYLEHFISRFYYFQSRVALPEEHFSEPEEKGGET